MNIFKQKRFTDIIFILKRIANGLSFDIIYSIAVGILSYYNQYLNIIMLTTKKEKKLLKLFSVSPHIFSSFGYRIPFITMTEFNNVVTEKHVPKKIRSFVSDAIKKQDGNIIKLCIPYMNI
jgi:hypothetical protein